MTAVIKPEQEIIQYKSENGYCRERPASTVDDVEVLQKFQGYLAGFRDTWDPSAFRTVDSAYRYLMGRAEKKDRVSSVRELGHDLLSYTTFRVEHATAEVTDDGKVTDRYGVWLVIWHELEYAYCSEEEALKKAIELADSRVELL